MDQQTLPPPPSRGAALAALGPAGRALALADFLPVTSTVHYAFVLTAGPGPGPARMRWRA
jgi:hypothetical protein